MIRQLAVTKADGISHDLTITFANMARSKIEWLARPGTMPESWSPVTGCNRDAKRIKISPGCDHCWAERMARRLAGRCGYPPMPHHFDVTLHPERLEQPLRWRKPRTIFICSMSDLCHEKVPDRFIFDVFQMMEITPEHTYLVLTKRPARLLELIIGGWLAVPLPDNIWLGVTAENQQTADERIPLLLQTPAAVRFVSVEPILERVELLDRCFLGIHREAGMVTEFDGDRVWYKRPGRGIVRHDGPKLDWVISGGESGPGARPAHPDWFRSLRDQCQAAGVSFFFKQWGAWKPIGDFDPQSGTYHYSWRHAEPYKRVLSVGLDGRTHNNDYPPSDGIHMARVGKKAAGRLLDGREWNEWPKEG